MTVQCVECTYFSLRDARHMARHGFGHCQRVQRPHTFFGADTARNCAAFLASDGVTVQARQDWLETQRQKFRLEIGL